MRDYILFLSILGFMSGIFLRSFFDVSFEYMVFGMVAALILAIIAWFRRERRIVFATLSLFLFVGLLGVLRFEWSASYSGVLDDSYLDRPVTLEGIVVSEPDIRENSARLVVKIESIDTVPVGKSEQTMVSTVRTSLYAYGDRVRVSGVLERPETFLTDTGKIFDYPSYLKKDNILYQMSFAKVEILERSVGNPIITFLLGLKHEFLDGISRVMPDPEASLLGGIVVGAKESLGTDLTEQFRRTGIVHIVVLSGYNLSIVASAIMAVMRVFPPMVALSSGALSIVLFALMAGASATVVRASLMALLVILAQATGRTYAILKALCIAGAVMVFYSPYTLVFDPSFQLSFLATAGLILLTPYLESLFAFVTVRFGFRSIIAATLGTQLMVLPLLLYMSGQLSLVSVPANILVIGIVPTIMFLGFITGLLAMVWDVLAYPFSFVTYALLHYIFLVNSFLDSVPFSSVTFPYVSSWVMVGLYAVLIYWIWSLYKSEKLIL